jgi:hypothetical protein
VCRLIQACKFCVESRKSETSQTPTESQFDQTGAFQMRLGVVATVLFVMPFLACWLWCFLFLVQVHAFVHMFEANKMVILISLSLSLYIYIYIYINLLYY